MNDRCTQITIILLAILVGWLGHDAFKVEEATAQSEVVSVQPATQQFSECAAVTIEPTRDRRVNRGEQPESTVRIPEGWTLFGGGGLYSDGLLILCR